MKSLIKSKYSYLFVSYIPKDLSNHFGGRNKFRVSLKSVQFCKQIHNLLCLYNADITDKNQLLIKGFTTKSEEFDSEIWKVFGGDFTWRVVKMNLLLKN